MELWLPQQITLSETSLAMIHDVDTAARRVNDRRPFPPPVVARIRNELEDELLGERVYSSNAIEGNTLDLRETVMILKRSTASTTKKREEKEARNLGEAVKRVGELVESGEAIHTRSTLLDIHRLVLHEIDDNAAGRFRHEQNMIQGARRQPPDHTLVLPLVDRVLELLDSGIDSNPILLGAWTHWAIARIHPFLDGNGRMARLWQDLVLLKNGLTCAIIRPEDRRDYLDALASADEGDFNALVQLISQRVSLTLAKYATVLEEEEHLDEDIRVIVGEADERVKEKRELSYVRWSRKMEQLRWAFESCASRITDVSEEIKVQVKPRPIIDQPLWEVLRSGQPVPQSGFFIVNFYRGDSCHRGYNFFFGCHYWVHGLDDAQDRAEKRACILASEYHDDGRAVRLDELDDSSLTLREVFVVEGHFVRKRRDLAKDEDVYDRDISPLDIAKDFMREVILNRLT